MGLVMAIPQICMELIKAIPQIIVAIFQALAQLPEQLGQFFQRSMGRYKECFCKCRNLV